MNKKVQRAMYGPGIVEVVLGAVLSLALGIVLAGLYLLFKPVSVVDKLPAADKREPGMVYYVQGAKGAGKGGQLLRKQQLFLEGSSVILTEDELNTWMASSNGAPKKPADPKAPAANEVNFHLSRGMLQVGIPYTVDLFGMSGAVIIQLQGAFAKEGDEFVYEPTTIYIGSLPVQRIPVLMSFLKKKIYAAQELPDELSAAWKKLANVSIEDNKLRLTMAK
ncbi:MAG TPA: hypothetical protein VNW30_09910 [Opitutaceae bacterium]|jgi:hypothetical protein|nr:hypothetical protein [Opitutaceae bacterium]